MCMCACAPIRMPVCVFVRARVCVFLKREIQIQTRMYIIMVVYCKQVVCVFFNITFYWCNLLIHVVNMINLRSV